jgi:hypothetical protein
MLRFARYLGLALVLAFFPCTADTNTPTLAWDTKVDPSGIFAYHACVACSETAALECSGLTLVWDTGDIWQENVPFVGVCHYTGPPLAQGQEYFWSVWETQWTTVTGMALRLAN